MLTLLLARHGQTQWNVSGHIQGHLDSPLTTLGWQQAECLAQQLASQNITAIYSSDLGRARQSAELVAQRCGVPLYLDSRLRERHFGQLQGKRPCQYPSLGLQYKNRFSSSGPGLSGAESADELLARALSFFMDLRRSEHLNFGLTGRVLIMSHGEFLHILNQCLSPSELARPLVPHCQVQRHSLDFLLTFLLHEQVAQQVSG